MVYLKIDTEHLAKRGSDDDIKLALQLLCLEDVSPEVNLHLSETQVSLVNISGRALCCVDRSACIDPISKNSLSALIYYFEF